MTQVESLAKYAARASFADLSAESRRQLPIHILDSLGCSIAALGAGPIQACREQVAEFGGTGPSTLIGGGQANPIYAAFWHTALVRYVDFMDNFLARTETCHTADNFGVALTIADYVGGSGRDLMLGVALGYTVQSRLVDHANFMTSGFDHTDATGLFAQRCCRPPDGVKRAADCARHRDGSGQRCVLRRRSGQASVAVERPRLVAVCARRYERAVPGSTRRRGTAASGGGPAGHRPSPEDEDQY